MPCERKHIKAIRKAWVLYKNDHHNPVPWKWERTLDNSIDTALAACDESPWRGMDSAPKDGRAVLLHNNNAPGNPSGRMESCEGYNTVVGEWWASDQSDDGADGFGDWTCYMDAIEDPRCPFNPTHWMPLPAAPEVKHD